MERIILKFLIIVRLFINGELKAFEDFVSGIGSTSTNLYIGAESDISGPLRPYFNGLIDEIHIYSRALSADEIKDHYEEYALVPPTPTTKITPTLPTPPSGKIKAIWLYNPDKYDTPTLMTDLKSAGINIDIEPYVDLDLEQVWQDHITLLEAIHEKTDGKTVLSADIPRWYDEGKIKDLAPNVDFFVIMAYDSGGAGWNTASEIEDAVASEMGAIRGEGSDAVIGIGVHEGFRDKDAVEKCIEDLYNYYSDDPAFLGVSIFKYESYSEGGFKDITIGELVEKMKKDPESVVGKKFAAKGLVLVSTHEGYKGISTLWKILRITSLIGSAGIVDIEEIPPEWLAADFMAIISNSAQDQDFCDMHKAFPYIEAYATNEELWAKSGSVINMEGDIEEKKILWYTFYVFKIENIESDFGYINLRGLLKSNEGDKVKIMCVIDKNLNGMGLYDFIHIQTQQSVDIPYQALVEIEPNVPDYTMSIDYDGDETVDEEKEPVSEVIEVSPEMRI